MRSLSVPLLLLCLLAASAAVVDAAPVGYYRQPTIHAETIVFVAEGDLWRVSTAGGVAVRLTSHAGDEQRPAISPDGGTLGFVAHYEGPAEVYTMPLEGGLPVRRTYGGGGKSVSGWTPAGRLIFSTRHYSTLPSWQLLVLAVSEDDVAGDADLIPLAQAADGCYDDEGRTLYFTRLRFQGSHTKRYAGGTAQNLWKFSSSATEAVPLTADYPGTSKRPMCWRGRVYFASDRDGTMNLWSMDGDGDDLEQHTRHVGWDVKDPYLQDGRIVYQLGADLRIHEISSGEDRRVPITLNSDLDQTREHWVHEPMSYLSTFHPDGDGERVVLTSRGRVFVAPRNQGRLVEVTRKQGVRYRDARFMGDGQTLVALSDESGEVELWQLPANGVGPRKQLTDNGEVLRWAAVASPDGKHVAHHDKNQRLFVFDVASGRDREIDRSAIGDFANLAWSPDSRWLAYVAAADNLFSQIKLYDVERRQTTAVTSDRFDSYEPAWSPDGKWLYLLSDRNLRSIVGSPWGSYQPEPYLDKTTQIFHVALTEGLRSPFEADDELQGDDEEEAKKDDGDADDEEPEVQVEIQLEGIRERLRLVPAPPGNYAALALAADALYFESTAAGESETNLVAVKITREELELETVLADIEGFELTANREKILVRKDSGLYVIAAKPEEAKLDEAQIDLEAWRFSVDPREEWRQMFFDAWRLERDYFYDRDMHGVDWTAMRDKYASLLDRITSRGELSDLLAQMVSELSALHIFVRGGDTRTGQDTIGIGSLGAVLRRDEAGGGYRVQHIYRSDPDEPERAAPLLRPGVDVAVGDLIRSVNGVETLSVPDIGAMLRDQVERQVLLSVQRSGGGELREVIVEPISSRRATDLRYHEWEYTRRLEVEKLSAGEIGYVHLRAMGGGNYTEWATNFYPVFNRKGLIVDVRHNRGGNIDSWILEKLLRKAWFYWSQRMGRAPVWNMQYAFRGHAVVLCNETTASDGEAFAEGFRRLGIGTVIGTRTWGGEIWLTSSNRLLDRGIATAAEFGVFSPDGEWLIEGHGVEPDIVVDNLPHETFNGRDAQLEAAVEYLRKKIREEPIEIPEVPRHPDMSFPRP